MLSPAIKINKFDNIKKFANASLINLNHIKKYKIEFSNINFVNLNQNVLLEDKIDLNNITNRNEIEFNFTIKNDEDKFLFCKIYEWDLDKWKESHIATAIMEERNDEIEISDKIQIEKRYVGPNDKIGVLIKASPETKYDVKIDKKTFGIKTDNFGFAKLYVNTINAIDYPSFSGKFVKKLICSLIDTVEKNIIAKTECEFVPEKIYALAATNDPDRPSCVILDPDPVASFSVTTDPFDTPCFTQPLVGKTFNTLGEDYSDSTRIDPKYTNCNDGYVSAAESAVESECKIFNQPRIAKIYPSNSENISNRVKDLFESAINPITNEELSLRPIGFTYSSCDKDAALENISLDPCAFSSGENKKIPRIFIGCTTDASSLKIFNLSRGIIKTPPSYFHSIVIGDESINEDMALENGDVVNVVFDLANGQRISKSLEFSESTHGEVSIFIEAFASELSSDENLTNFGISLKSYPSKKRIDVYSDSKFNIFAGQANIIDPNTGDYKINNNVYIVRDSKYTLDFEITDPANYEDINNLLNSGATHMLFLDTKFKGMVVPINNNSLNGTITVDTCPRVSTERKGLGSFEIDKDILCAHVAFVSKEIATEYNTIISPMPFVLNKFGEVVPSINPVITSSGDLFCQALVDGKWQLFAYFPNLIDSKWIQLTYEGENRNVHACSDKFGNVHIVWETDRFGYTSIQYACIGSSAKLINRLVLSGLISKQFTDELYSKTFSINENENSLNFIQSSSFNIELLPEKNKLNLLPGSEIGGGKFYIAREFTGNLRIDDEDFANLIDEVESPKLGPTAWLSKKEPELYQGIYCTSYIVHFEQIGTNTGDDLTASFSADFAGKILRVFMSPADLVKSNKYFTSDNILYPDGLSPLTQSLRDTYYDNNSLVLFAGEQENLITVSLDYKTLNFTFSYVDSDSIGPLQFRVLVEGVKSQSSLNLSNWNRIFSNNGKVSIAEESTAFVECSPKNDCAIASLSIFQDINGNYISGQESEINFSVNSNCTISPKSTEKISPTSNGSLNFIPIEFYQDLIERDNAFSTTWNQSSKPIFYIQEFSGQPGFDQVRQYASKYKNGNNEQIVSFENTKNRYFSGFNASSYVQSFTISINAGFLITQEFRDIYFGHEILALYVGRNDLEETDFSLGNGSADRENLLQDQNVTISVNQTKNTIKITMKPGYVDFSIRVVVSSSEFDYPFNLKNDKQIKEYYDNFVQSFSKTANDKYLLHNNKFTIASTEKRFDEIIPLAGILKFDDINMNPNAVYGTFGNLLSTSYTEQNIDVSTEVDSVSIGTYELQDQFNLDGDDAHLHHAYVCLIPEKITFAARNSETLDEYESRTGSIDGYREAIIKDVYTGYAKAGVIANGDFYSGKRTSISLGTILKVSDQANIKIEDSLKLQFDASYLRLSEEEKETLLNWAHISKDAFYPPSSSQPNYHLMFNLFINDKPVLSHNAQIDLSDKTRQWDIGFGSPFGQYPVCRNSDATFLDLLSSKNWEIKFENIRVGNPRVLIKPKILDNTYLLNSNSNIISLIPNSDSNINNEKFEQSFSDPGDWICLENGSLIINNWTASNGGCVYVGTYANIYSGKRSVILESCIEYETDDPVSYYLYPQFISRRKRISTGQFGGISQSLGTANVSEGHQIVITSGLRQVQESYPKITKTVLVKIGDSAFSYRQNPSTGEFVNSESSLDFTTFKSSFTPSSSSFNIDIRNVSEGLNGCFSYFPYNTINLSDSYDTESFASHQQGAITRDVIFYINSDAKLIALKSYYNGSSMDTEEFELAESIIYFDSRLKFSNNASQNPFCISITNSGYLQTFTLEDTEDNLPNFALQNSLPSSDGFINVSVGYEHACALKNDGTVVCWGSNSNGECNVPSGYKFIQVKAGQYFTIGITEEGNLLAWGINTYGQISPLPSGKFIKIDAGAEHAVGIKIDNTVVSWGRNAGTSNLQDPTTKMVDVAACGGNTYSLETSGSSVSVYNIQPFNIGIDINGNILEWGKYTEAFTPLVTAREQYHEKPSIPCVSVKRGLKNCLLLGIDGKVYAYGIAFGPSAPDSPSNVKTLYKTDKDFISGGPIIESVYVYADSNLIEEDKKVNTYRLRGMTSDKEFNISYGLPLASQFLSIPLVWESGTLQKSPYCDVDIFNKCSIVWEDNSQGNWSICESSNIWLNRSFSDRIYLSEKDYLNSHPSISSDRYGRRAVSWSANEKNKYAIKLATHNLHPDYASECDIDKIISSSRSLGVDTDPYDPYNIEQSLMSCRVDVSFTAPEFGNYFFTISFKDIDNENIIYKQSSSKTESGKWLINDKYISYDGQVIAQGEKVKVSFVPDSNDDVFNKVLKVEITYSTEETSSEEMLFLPTKSQGIYPGVTWWDSESNYPININGNGSKDGSPYNSEYLIFSEAAINAPVSISSQNSDYFESQGISKDKNFVFPTGVTSLPGFSSGTFVKSFLFVLGDNGTEVASPVEATLSFNQPIVAVIIDKDNLTSTDLFFKDDSAPVNVKRTEVVSNFQFYDGEYIRLDEDRKKLHVRFYRPRASSWPTPLSSISSNIQKNLISKSSSSSSESAIIFNRDLISNPPIVSDQLVDVTALAYPDGFFPYATFRVIVSNTGSVSGQITTTYFCSTPIKSTCKISTSYKNPSSEQKNVHFKVSVYGDSEYKDAIMSFSSKSDPKLWSNGSNIFPLNGIVVAPNTTGSVSFVPPVININQNQYPFNETSVNEQSRIDSLYSYYNLTRTSLICGLKYYIVAEAVIDNNDIELYRTSFLCGCNDNLSDREDEFEWRSPRNSSQNCTVAMYDWYVGWPHIKATDDGLFCIVWEDSRSSQNLNGLSNKLNQNMDIYAAFYDANKDYIDSSYHSGIDRILLNTSISEDKNRKDQRMPLIYADKFSNFTVFSSSDFNTILKRYLSVGAKIKPTIIEESAITTACSFTLTDINRYQTAFDGGEFMQIKVSDKYVKGYKFIDTVGQSPIVNDCFIDLEIIGIPGAIAYKIKNESEAEFTDWIPINLPIQPLDSLGKTISEDVNNFRETFKGRWITNEIFSIPWVLSKSDGVKRVCMEVLTAFGKTQTFCIDIISEYSNISYIVEIFYSDESDKKLYQPVRYKGIPVVNKKTYYKKSEADQKEITISKEDLRSLDLETETEVNVYVQVTFDDPERISRINALNRISYYAARRKDLGSMKLIMHQQGIRIQTADLESLDEKNGIYYGTFKINKNNGVTDKDGLAFVFVDLPSECLNPFTKNFISTLRLISDERLDSSNAKIIDNNMFIEQYSNNDKRNAFGSRRLN